MRTITNELACGHRKSTIPDIFISLSNIRSHLAVAWCLFGVHFLGARERTGETYETMETSHKRKKIKEKLAK
jgi:hypothetical protein